MPRVSIIIPVFNAALHLDRCLNSVFTQIVTDWECVLIDDGSSDNSYGICSSWAERDDRFIVIHQRNAGVSNARNRGLDIGTGKYIVFIDADDWIEPDYLLELLSHTGESDLVVSGQIRDFLDGKRIEYQPDSTICFELEKKNARRLVELESSLLLYAVHEKVFKSDIIKKAGIRFLESCSHGEDLLFVFNYLRYVKVVQQISYSGYHYQIARNNTLSSTFRPFQFREDYSQWTVIDAFYKAKGIDDETIRSFHAKRLWGIVYDGVFIFPKLDNPTRKYLKEVLSIPEIEMLREQSHVFYCSRWIKQCILRRWSLVFFFYFKVANR